MYSIMIVLNTIVELWNNILRNRICVFFFFFSLFPLPTILLVVLNSIITIYNKLTPNQNSFLHFNRIISQNWHIVAKPYGNFLIPLHGYWEYYCWNMQILIHTTNQRKKHCTQKNTCTNMHEHLLTYTISVVLILFGISRKCVCVCIAGLILLRRVEWTWCISFHMMKLIPTRYGSDRLFL